MRGDYTLNVPKEGMKDIVDFCGVVSGRDHEKFKEKSVAAIPSRKVNSPIFGECMFQSRSTIR